MFLLALLSGGGLEAANDFACAEPCELRHLIAGAGVLVGKLICRLVISLASIALEFVVLLSGLRVLGRRRPAFQREANGVPHHEFGTSASLFPDYQWLIAHPSVKGKTFAFLFP